MAVLGLAIAIGGLIGLPALHFRGVDIGVSAPVGVLIGGLVVGWRIRGGQFSAACRMRRCL
jgi:putative transport protein